MARPGKEQSGANLGLTSWDRRHTAPAMNGEARPRSGAVSRVIPEEVTEIPVSDKPGCCYQLKINRIGTWFCS